MHTMKMKGWPHKEILLSQLMKSKHGLCVQVWSCSKNGWPSVIIHIWFVCLYPSHLKLDDLNFHSILDDTMKVRYYGCKRTTNSSVYFAMAAASMSHYSIHGVIPTSILEKHSKMRQHFRGICVIYPNFIPRSMFTKTPL